ncbi:MAG: UDP-N-acetylmuramate dehydrogenase, partial [Clostridia bacterium]|nr:UDP-N-acetylmuramate dehydrogenase [Clostridia bacterium]
MPLFEKIASRYPSAMLLKDEPMSRHTTFRVGGKSDIMFFPENEEMLAFAIRTSKEENVPLTVIGNGSNLLVKDGGIRGLTVVLGEAFSGVTVDGNTVTALAGEPLARLSKICRNHSLTGLEFAAGIPGTLGGAMAMNAGAYGGEMKDVCVSARLMSLEDGSVEEYPAEKLELSYRSSMPLKTGKIVTSAVFKLKDGNKDEITAKMEDLNARRREKQPLTYPSAGSTFKRPEGYFAGALIEGANLKGASVGGAQVSTLHAGFIINTGNATAKDLLDL